MMDRMVKAKKLGWMAQDMKVSIKMDLKMVMVSLDGLISQLILVNLKKINVTEKVNRFGLMVVSTMEIGSTTNYKVRESIPGQMANVMKEAT